MENNNQTYKESEKKLNKLESEYGITFRMAISHLMDVGIRHLTDENIEETCKEIMKKDDSKSIMTNNFQCDIVRLAGEIAKIPHLHILTYIQENMYWDVGQKNMSYQRMKDLLINSINWLCSDVDDVNEIFDDIDIESDELRYLGFNDLATIKEESENY